MLQKENQDFDTPNQQEMSSTDAPLKERKTIFIICILEADCEFRSN